MRFDDGPRPTVALQCVELIGEPRSEDGWHSSDAAVAGGDNRRVDREERAKMLGSHQRLVAEREQNPRACRRHRPPHESTTPSPHANRDSGSKRTFYSLFAVNLHMPLTWSDLNSIFDASTV